jgi:hypothetical protein
LPLDQLPTTAGEHGSNASFGISPLELQTASGRSERETCAWRRSTGPAAAYASRWTGCGTSTSPAAKAKGPSGTSPYDPSHMTGHLFDLELRHQLAIQ